MLDIGHNVTVAYEHFLPSSSKVDVDARIRKHVYTANVSADSALDQIIEEAMVRDAGTVSVQAKKIAQFVHFCVIKHALSLAPRVFAQMIPSGTLCYQICYSVRFVIIGQVAGVAMKPLL